MRINDILQNNVVFRIPHDTFFARWQPASDGQFRWDISYGKNINYKPSSDAIINNTQLLVDHVYGCFDFSHDALIKQIEKQYGSVNDALNTPRQCMLKSDAVEQLYAEYIGGEWTPSEGFDVLIREAMGNIRDEIKWTCSINKNQGRIGSLESKKDKCDNIVIVDGYNEITSQTLSKLREDLVSYPQSLTQLENLPQGSFIIPLKGREMHRKKTIGHIKEVA